MNDFDFGMVKLFNLENCEVFLFVIEYGKKFGGDILVGIDLDVDCLGVVVCNFDGEYEVLFGN